MKNPRPGLRAARQPRGGRVAKKSWGCARARGIFYAFLLNLCRGCAALTRSFRAVCGGYSEKFWEISGDYKIRSD